MNIFQKNLIKSIVKKSVPTEKQEEVLSVIDKLDLDLLIKDPTALATVLSNPSKLGDYVVKDSSDNADVVDNIFTSDIINESVEDTEKP